MDNQQRFQNTRSQDTYQQTQSGFDNTGTGTDTGYNKPTGTGYGDSDTTAQQYGDTDNSKTGAYSTGQSAPGSGFDNNAPNVSDTSGGYNDSGSGGAYGSSSYGRGDYATENTGIDDTQGDASFSKPSAGDKMRGSAEKMMGKMTGNTGMQERGEGRKTGNLRDY